MCPQSIPGQLVRSFAVQGKIRFTLHALERMDERMVEADAVVDAIAGGHEIEVQPASDVDPDIRVLFQEAGGVLGSCAGRFAAAKSLEGMKKMNECLLCGGVVKEITTSVKKNWGGKHPLTISGIPAEQCDACGEITFSLEATRLIQSISRWIVDGSAWEKPDFLALPEVAALLKVSRQTIYNMVRDGRLQAQKVGREWRFHREGLDQLLAPSVLLAARADQVTQRDMAAVQKRISAESKQ